jgi:hypothetical protein
MYTASLVLRNTDEDIWSEEWIPREAYGYSIAFMIVILVPSPILIHIVDKKRNPDTKTLERLKHLKHLKCIKANVG